MREPYEKIKSQDFQRATFDAFIFPSKISLQRRLSFACSGVIFPEINKNP